MNDCPNCVKHCSRCGTKIGEHWSQAEYFNSGEIRLSIPASGQMYFDNKTTHPAVARSEECESAQSLHLRWGTYSRANDAKYHLCLRCNRELWRALSDFFNGAGTHPSE